MKLKLIIHEAEEGGFWAEVPSIPGCATQGEDLKELIANIYDAVEGCLSIDMDAIKLENTDTVMELAVQNENYQWQKDEFLVEKSRMDTCPYYRKSPYFCSLG